MEVKQYWFVVTDPDYPEQVRTQHIKTISEDATWPEVLAEFCKFIEKEFEYPIADKIKIKKSLYSSESSFATWDDGPKETLKDRIERAMIDQIREDEDDEDEDDLILGAKMVSE